MVFKRKTHLVMEDVFPKPVFENPFSKWKPCRNLNNGIA
jgi:hypothetical protein